MNVHAAPRVRVESKAAARVGVVDCDIHPVVNAQQEMLPFLDPQWHRVLAEYGTQRRQGMQFGSMYPKSQPEANRRDATPPRGLAGGVLDFMQAQHLDEHNVEIGVLNPLGGGMGIRHPGLAAAVCHAMNDWQLATWVDRDPRLKASVCVPYNIAAAAAKEIEARASDGRFIQVLVLSRTGDPLGTQRYWPIFEAAEAAGLPIGVHAFGQSGYPVTGSGWPSYYFEETFGHSVSCQAVVTSLVMEGVFERFPKLRFIIIEAGVAWMPSLMWRLDRQWMKLRSEVPHLKRPPSEYIREHIWVSTQPIEEPEPREHMIETLEWMGWDRICFASDYPHWDFDDPMLALPQNKLTREQRDRYFHLNAKELYKARLAMA